MAWPTSSRPHDNDCLCLPSTPSPRNREAGEKESMDRHHSQAYPPCAVLSSLTSLARGLRAVRTAANGSARHSPVKISAKVVLGRRRSLSPSRASELAGERPDSAERPKSHSVGLFLRSEAVEPPDLQREHRESAERGPSRQRTAAIGGSPARKWAETFGYLHRNMPRNGTCPARRAPVMVR